MRSSLEEADPAAAPTPAPAQAGKHGEEQDAFGCPLARTNARGDALADCGSCRPREPQLWPELRVASDPRTLPSESPARPKEGITLSIAGNNRLIPVQKVTAEDFCILSKLLKDNPYINGLDVRYNLINDIGAHYAAKLLQKQLYLIYLNLMFNDIGPEGGELLAKALHKNTTLKYLRMTGNKIENKGGMVFAAMLQINSSLEKLDVGDCDLGMQSVVAFATVLTQNQAIKGINLNRPILYGEQAYSDLIQKDRLKPENTDVEPFVVDGHVYLAEVSNGLKKHYYWTPTYGDAYGHSSNSGFALVPVGQNL
ncbi:Leucine-rich repeat-containing protein 34 [Heterocephalus glaber]|uniref:Leucine-rich repeat-containing protein 34 n=1 Tax=Heterocephalus glaber TaxID=10181 RepID=G5AXZ9_HETGA|nr:Leucine-rich repeat-containing protein 34 [Heterocephalus glaber]